MVENCDIMSEILHTQCPFEPIRDPNNCDVRLIFSWSFFSCIRNYYNDNKKPPVAQLACNSPPSCHAKLLVFV